MFDGHFLIQWKKMLIIHCVYLILLIRVLTKPHLPGRISSAYLLYSIKCWNWKYNNRIVDSSERLLWIISIVSKNVF